MNMKKKIFWFSAAALAALLCVSCGPKHNVLTAREEADGWQLLFDGETLEGWRDYNGDSLTGPWKVVEGTILAEGHGDDASGYIVTDREYANFHLKWDWKISKGGNSGVLYHVVERPDFAVPYVTGPEYQLIDDENFAEMNDGYVLEDWQRCGVDYAMYVPDFETRDLKPAGEWNQSEIVFDNGHVIYYLNGKVTVEFDAWTPDWFARKNSGKWENAPEYGLSRRGVICLQDHGYPAWFRNIKIKELPVKSVEKDLFNGKDLTGWINYGTELWYVDEATGELVCESGPDKGYGYFATEEYYDDFDLSLEFKQEANGNSGVFIRSTVEGTTVSGWQVEVAPKGQDTGGIYESYGRGWLVQIPEEKEDILKEGEWNQMRILVKGDNVQTWLNGQQMVDLTDAKIGAGHGRIALQIHDGGGIKVRWRNLRIKTL
ncbi:MAG: DUF1080 domain-containing protein [Bacteroidales bacterium]|jgi:hypothetical protein|nr:DUF1080 domain-containing protein [Bacteroidales bacterium]